MTRYLRLIHLILGLLARPRLWIPTLRVWRRFIPDRWWMYWPFLPVPPRKFLEFRMETAYGDKKAIPTIEDFSRYVRWCRRMDRLFVD